MPCQPIDTDPQKRRLAPFSRAGPYGNGLFGDMLCFRNIKQEYLRVTSKDEFWAVHGREDRQVQETYLCEQFVLRVAGTGYRG